MRSMDLMLRHTLDRNQRLQRLRQAPVVLEFVWVHLRPLAHQSQRPRWERARQNLK
jgi:hypothetical protein